MNPFEMVAVIVVAVMLASVLRAKYGHGSSRRDGNRDPVEDQAETLRLREEVKALKDRIHVLERIAVEKEDTLSRQIDDLRDR